MYSTAGPSSALSSLRFAEELEDDDLYDFSDVQKQGSAAPVVKGPLVRAPKRLDSSSSLASIAESAEEALAESGDISDDEESSRGSSPLEGSLSEASLDSGGRGHSHPELQQQVVSANKLAGGQGAGNQGGPIQELMADEELALLRDELESDDEDVLDMLGLEDTAGRHIATGKSGLASLKALPPLGKNLRPLNPLTKPPFRPSPLVAGASLEIDANKPIDASLQGTQSSIIKGSLAPKSREVDPMLTAGRSDETAVDTRASTSGGSLSSQSEQAEDGMLRHPVTRADEGPPVSSNLSESLSDPEGGSSEEHMSFLGEEAALEEDGVEGGLSGEESLEGAMLKVEKCEGSGMKEELRGGSAKEDSEEKGDLLGGEFEGKSFESEASEGSSMEDEELGEVDDELEEDEELREEGAGEGEDCGFENDESFERAESDGFEEEELKDDGRLDEDGFEMDEESGNGFGEEGIEEVGEGFEDELDDDCSDSGGVERSQPAVRGTSDAGKKGVATGRANARPSAFQSPVLTHAPECGLTEEWLPGVLSKRGEEQPAVVEKKVVVEGPFSGGSVLEGQLNGRGTDQSIGRPTEIAGTGGALALLERNFAQEKLLELLTAARQDEEEGDNTALGSNDDLDGSAIANVLPALDSHFIGRNAIDFVSSPLSGRGRIPPAAAANLETLNPDSCMGVGLSVSHSDRPSEVADRLEALETLRDSLKERRSPTNAEVGDAGSSFSVPFSMSIIGAEDELSDPRGQNGHPKPRAQEGVATPVIQKERAFAPVSPRLNHPTLPSLGALPTLKAFERNTSGTEASASRTASGTGASGSRTASPDSEGGNRRAGSERGGTPLLQAEELLGSASELCQDDATSAEQTGLTPSQQVKSEGRTGSELSADKGTGSGLEHSGEEALGNLGVSVGLSGAGMIGDGSDESGNGVDEMRGRRVDEAVVESSIERGSREQNESSASVSHSSVREEVNGAGPVVSTGGLPNPPNPSVALGNAKSDTADKPDNPSRTQQTPDTWREGKASGARQDEAAAATIGSGGENTEKGPVPSNELSSHATEFSKGIPLADGKTVAGGSGRNAVLTIAKQLELSSPPEALSGEPLAEGSLSDPRSHASQQGLSPKVVDSQSNGTVGNSFAVQIAPSGNSAKPAPLETAAGRSELEATCSAADHIGGRPGSTGAEVESCESSESPTKNVEPVEPVPRKKRRASAGKNAEAPGSCSGAFPQSKGQSAADANNRAGERRDEIEHRHSLSKSGMGVECLGEIHRGKESASPITPEKGSVSGEFFARGSRESRGVSESSDGGSVTPQEDLKRTDRSADVITRNFADVSNRGAPEQAGPSYAAERRQVDARRRSRDDVSRNRGARDDVSRGALDDVGRRRHWGEADENADVGDSDFGGRLLNREIRELRKIQKARRAAEKERLGAAVGALHEWKNADGGAGVSNGNERRRSSHRKPAKRGQVSSDVSSDFSCETPMQSGAPVVRLLHATPLAAPRGLEVSRAAERAAAEALESAHVATSRAAELEQALARKEREVARLARLAQGFSAGAGAAERELRAEVAEMARERDGALQERKALLEQLARRDRQLAERYDEVDRLKSAVAKLADQRVADSARAEDAARAREARIRELEEGLRASERLRTEAEIEMRTHQERQAHFATEKQRLSDALAASQASEQGLVQKLDALQSRLSDALSAARASEQGLVQKLDVLQSRIDASSESRLRASEAANAALTQKVEGLLTKISGLEGELRHVTRARARQVVHLEDFAKRATAKEPEESVESPRSVSGLLSDGEEEPASVRVDQGRKTKAVKWPKPGDLAPQKPANPQHTTTHVEENSEQNGRIHPGLSSEQETTVAETLGRKASSEWEERMVQSDGEGPAGGLRRNRAFGEKVAELEREVKELRGALHAAKEGQQAARDKYAALLRNLRAWMEGRRYTAKTAPQLTVLVPLLAWRNVPYSAERVRAQWQQLVEGLCAENTESSPRPSFVTRMSRLRQHRRCLSAQVDRQFLLAALRVWRAEVASGEARAAGQRAQAREEELERITCALPWWVRRVSERAALARFFLHWRLAGATGKRQGLEAWRRERDSAPGELPAPLRAEPVQRRFLEGHQRSEAFTEATRFVEVQRDRVGVPSEMGVSSEKGVPPELLSGMMGADGGDAIQAELRAIREMVHARLLELSQHDEISAEVPLKRPECALQASESDGLHTCQSQQDVIQHLITVLTDLQDRVTGGVTPAAASARALQTSTRVDEVSAEMEIKEGGTGALGSLKTQAHVEEEEGGAKPSSDLRAGDESSLEVKVESAKQSVALERVDTRRRALQDFSAGKGRRPIARGSMKTNVNGRTRHWAP